MSALDKLLGGYTYQGVLLIYLCLAYRYRRLRSLTTLDVYTSCCLTIDDTGILPEIRTQCYGHDSNLRKTHMNVQTY
jgi:hypothetical protein